MLDFRFGVFAQLIAGFVVVVFFMILSSGIGIWTLYNFNKGVEEIASDKLPALTLAYQLGQQSETISSNAPILAGAVSQAERERLSFKVSDRVRWLEEIIAELKGFIGHEIAIERIEATRERLLRNYAEIDQLVRDRIEIRRTYLNQRQRLQNTLIASAFDDETFQILRQKLISVLLLHEQAAEETSLLEAHKDLRTFIESADNLESFLEKGDLNWIEEITQPGQGFLSLKESLVSVERKTMGLLALNERLSSRFVYAVNELIVLIRDQIKRDSQSFQKLVEERTWLLSLLVLACLLIGGGIGAYVFRGIVNRLNLLKRSMLIHAKGQNALIPLGSNDEIGDMGKALDHLVKELRARELEIRDSEERYRDVTEATSDWLWETNENDEFTFVSDRCYEITNLSPEDVIGKKRSTFVLENAKVDGSNDVWERHLDHINNREKFRDFIYSLKCPDGRWRRCKISGKPVFNKAGVFLGYRGTGQDITAEAQARSRLMAANEIMPGAFALWDGENRLVMCNRKFHQFYKEIDDLIVTGVDFDDLIDALEQRNCIVNQLDYGARRKEFHEQPNGVFMESLVGERYLQVSEARTLDNGTVSLVIDITERIEAEARLDQARLEAENANKAKSKFLAAASHDLRQPLHAIGMFLSALEDRRKRDISEEAQADLKIIQNISDSLDALRSLLNALLDISKLDAGVMQVDIRAVALRPLLERLVTQFEGPAGEKGLKLRLFCPEVAVKTDPILLERVMTNLVSNAVRYSEQGGILIGLRKRGQNCLIQVVDTGLGIPKDKLEEIFYEFQQLDNPHRDRRLGLGLGLAIVDRVVGLLGHEIDVSSVVGKGSVFSLHLPQAQMPKAEIAHSGEDDVQDADSIEPLIVIIDDEPNVLAAMVELIKTWRYEIIAAEDTDEALKKISAQSRLPTLILADYRLKGSLTGAKAIEHICRATGKKIPAAIITGDTAPDRIKEARDSGYTLLHKPLRPAKLRQLIRSTHRKLLRTG